jgi:hypothetical protein
VRPYPVIVTAVIFASMLGVAAPASADITAFLGAAGGPSARMAKGVAVGIGFVVFGIEFEYSDTSENVADLAPRIRTGMVNALVQTPSVAGGLQFYATIGAGGYVQDLGTLSETNVGTNLGGGLKKGLAGPFGFRVDYRMFRFSGAAFGHQIVHRVVVGANVRF